MDQNFVRRAHVKYLRKIVFYHHENPFKRTMRSVIPKNVNHVDSNVRSFFPDQNKIETENGELNYD